MTTPTSDLALAHVPAFLSKATQRSGGRLRTHSRRTVYSVLYKESDGEHLVIKNKGYIMHLLFAPVLASAIYIGGGLGLVLLIVVIVLVLR